MLYLEECRETLSSHRIKNDEHLKFHVISRKFLLYLSFRDKRVPIGTPQPLERLLDLY
jgi:hypothetical protein